MRVISVILLFLSFFAGCSHNFSHVHINIQNSNRKILLDPAVRFNSRATFSVVPSDQPKNGESRLQEKQILFLASWYLESNGFEYTDIHNNPDMLVTVGFSNEYESTYVPPSSYTVPVYHPGQTYYSNAYASVYSSSGYAYGHAHSTTTSSGFWTSHTVVSPGYYVGWFYPTVGLTIWDARTREELWTGRTVASTKNTIMPVSAPFLVFHIGEELPIRWNHPNFDKYLNGELLVANFLCVMLSRDGKLLFPTIVHVSRGSSPSRAGLRKWDIITQVNGVSTANIRWLNLNNLLTSERPKPVVLTVFRMGKTKSITINTEPLSDEYIAALRTLQARSQ